MAEPEQGGPLTFEAAAEFFPPEKRAAIKQRVDSTAGAVIEVLSAVTQAEKLPEGDILASGYTGLAMIHQAQVNVGIATLEEYEFPNPEHTWKAVVDTMAIQFLEDNVPQNQA